MRRTDRDGRRVGSSCTGVGGAEEGRGAVGSGVLIRTALQVGRRSDDYARRSFGVGGHAWWAALMVPSAHAYSRVFAFGFTRPPLNPRFVRNGCVGKRRGMSAFYIPKLLWVLFLFA